MNASSSSKESRVLAKARKLAKLGFYVGPLRPGTKNPGSRLGRGWQEKTSNDPATVSRWFKQNPEDGLFLHPGRSGLIAFDLDQDNLDALPKEVADDLRCGLFQRSQGAGDRGHYIFRTDEVFGNGAGGFSAWGDVRGKNGAIVLAPSIHPAAGKPYKHVRGDWSVIPKLPPALRSLLRTGVSSPESALSAKELRKVLDALSHGSKSELLDERCSEFRDLVGEGESRHNALLKTAIRVLQDAKAGEYPAIPAVERLRQEFEASFLASNAGKRAKPAEGEFEGIVAWAAAQKTTAESLDSLFEATPELRMVRRYAQERSVSPVALLLVGVAFALAAIPPRYVLPATVGTQAPPNLFVALTGPSGSGKGATEGVAGEVFQFPPSVVGDVYFGKPGSSEGIAKMYGHMVTRKEGKRNTQVPEFLRTRVIASLPEVDSLAALMGRDGSMISATLREVWTGSLLGHDYAQAHTKFLVGARTYRFCLLLGVQPDRSETLLQQRAGGLLQRFLWGEVTVPPGQFRHPTLDESDLEPIVFPEFRDENTETLRWRSRMGTSAGKAELIDLKIPEEVRAQILEVQALVRQGLTTDLEGHRLLTQEKVALGLAVMHGKTDGFTLEHWNWAGLLMRQSDETLHKMIRLTSANRLSNRLREARTAGKVRAVRSAAEEEARTKSTKKRIITLLSLYTQLSRARLRSKMSAAQRELFEIAIDELKSENALGYKTRQAANGEKSTFYFLLTGQ